MYRESDERLAAVRPSDRQLAQQEMEFYGFFHFGINTFTDREWGDGTESVQIFAPAGLADTDQWVITAKKAGMKGVILTCKHHDGFCLWPSAYTSHTIANAPYQEGKGDIVRQTAESCRKYDMKFGIYLSPWDRNHPHYGKGKLYDDYYVNQLTELLTGYGEVFCVWMDGACGAGTNGKAQQYDWLRYYETVRRLQPNACISVCGPDIRWCGNEAGDTRESEWNVVSARLSLAEETAKRSQQEDEKDFREQKLTKQDQDLGSRKCLAEEEKLIWYPAEVDMSIRPGWFYHAKEDEYVCSLERLKEIYIKTVGGNAMLLLNIPPNTEGRIAERDEKVLEQLGVFLKTAFAQNLAQDAQVYAKEEDSEHPAANLLKEEKHLYFSPGEKITETDICFRWKQKQKIHYVILQEYLPMGQRVEHFGIYDGLEGTRKLYQGNVIGHKHIAVLPEGTLTDELRLSIEDARCGMMLQSVFIC